VSETPAKFSEWCIVEVMGHQRYAGLVTDFTLGGAALIRVDVPEVDGRPAFTKLIAPGSLFCITPCSKEAVYEACQQFRARPFSTFDLVAARTPALPGFDPNDYEDEDD
jgi:hypothetical protein